jgi:hypothetical protein
MYFPVDAHVHFDARLPLIPDWYVSPGIWIGGFRTRTVFLRLLRFEVIVDLRRIS